MWKAKRILEILSSSTPKKPKTDRPTDVDTDDAMMKHLFCSLYCPPVCASINLSQLTCVDARKICTYFYGWVPAQPSSSLPLARSPGTSKVKKPFCYPGSTSASSSSRIENPTPQRRRPLRATRFLCRLRSCRCTYIVAARSGMNIYVYIWENIFSPLIKLDSLSRA